MTEATLTTTLGGMKSSLFSSISALLFVGRKNDCRSLSANSPITTSLLPSSIKKLTHHDHFHDEHAKVEQIAVTLIAYHPDARMPNDQLLLQIEIKDQKWCINRSIDQLCEFDQQLHRCVFNRTRSRLVELTTELRQEDHESAKMLILLYLQRLSYITDSLMRCCFALKFLEIDSHGNRVLAAEELSVNTSTTVNAIATKDFKEQTCDQISIRVGLFSREYVNFDSKSEPRDKQWQYFAQPIATAAVNGDNIPNKAANLTLMSKKVIASQRHPREDRSIVRTLLRQHVKRRITPVFGTDLVEYLQRTGEDVPIILKKCVEVIEMHGIVTGIYRQCGIQSNIQKLRNSFDSGPIPNMCDEIILKDIHSVSSLLKQYFRQLPNPLFTFELYTDFIDAYETADEKRADRFKNVIGRLPCEHYRTAKYLIRHLTKLCQCTHLTDMNSKNLAIVWAPNLFRCPPWVNDGASGSSESDSSLLRGLNAQTGLCNYILVHAVHLFSFEKEFLTFSKNTLCKLPASNPTSRRNDKVTRDMDHRPSIDVSSGSLKSPVLRTVPARPLLRNSSSNVRTSLRASRSASLISFVTKSVEEFRNGVMKSWCHCAPMTHDESIKNDGNSTGQLSTIALSREMVRQRSLTSFLANKQQSSTSPNSKQEFNTIDGVQETSLVEAYDSGSNRSSFTSIEYGVRDKVSMSSESSRFFGFDENNQAVQEAIPQYAKGIRGKRNRRAVESETILRVASCTGTTKNNRRSPADTSENQRSVDIGSSGSESTSSMQNDLSRYDNVLPGEEGARYAKTSFSFYDLPQYNAHTTRSNVHLYFL